MDDPLDEAIVMVAAVVNELTEAQERVAELKARLVELPYEIGKDFSGDRLKLAEQLYWFFEAIPVGSITNGILGVPPQRFLKMMTGSDCCIACAFCGSDVYAKSRTELRAFFALVADGRPFKCLKCRDDDRRAIVDSYATYQKEREEYLAAVRRMPYADYLLTEHWKRVRIRALYAAKFRCQVCNTGGVVLDVHHRTYERLGAEAKEDLIALCRECHELFHNSR